MTGRPSRRRFGVYPKSTIFDKSRIANQALDRRFYLESQSKRFRRNAVRVAKKTSVLKFVQIPLAGFVEMFEKEASMLNGSERVESRSSEAESDDEIFEFLNPAVPVVLR